MTKQSNNTSVTMDTNPLVPLPVNVTIQHIDSANTRNDHIDADAKILTAQLSLLMQAWPQLQNINEVINLSSHITDLLYKRRDLCLRPKSKADLKDGEDIDITPI